MLKKIPFRKIFAVTLGMILLFNFFLLETVQNVKAQENDSTLQIYMFGSKYCPHCAKEKDFLNELLEKYPQVTLNYLEVTETENQKLLMKFGETYGDEVGAVPFLVIGEKRILGFSDAKTTGVEIEMAIKKELEKPSTDMIATIEQDSKESTKSEVAQEVSVKVPFLGILNSSKTSLPLFTLGVALLDGFNPCAMWVLLFLISLLLGMENKRKRWILGLTFIFSSSLVYFLFLTTWLNFFMWIGFSNIVRFLIGFLAIYSGIKFVGEFFAKDSGCNVVEGNKNRRKILNTLKDVSQSKKLALAMLGMAGLAFAVNLIELVCSAGLPAIYTNVLSMSNLPSWEYYLYLFLYIVIFMLDDILVFVIAMITMQMVGIQSKYAKYSHLIGGILIFVIGILMLVRPDILMFN